MDCYCRLCGKEITAEWGQTHEYYCYMCDVVEGDKRSLSDEYFDDQAHDPQFGTAVFFLRKFIGDESYNPLTAKDTLEQSIRSMRDQLEGVVFLYQDIVDELDAYLKNK